MKRLIISIVIVLLLLSGALAQNIVFIDIETGKPISNVHVTCGESSFYVSDDAGRIMIGDGECDKLNCSHINYINEELILLHKSDLDTIYLVQELLDLAEVTFISFRSVRSIIKKAKKAYDHYYIDNSVMGEYKGYECIKDENNIVQIFNAEEGYFNVLPENWKKLKGEFSLFPKYGILPVSSIKSGITTHEKRAYYEEGIFGAGSSMMRETLMLEKIFRRHGPLSRNEYKYDFDGYDEYGNLSILFFNKKGISGKLRLEPKLLKCVGYSISISPNSKILRKYAIGRCSSREFELTVEYTDFHDRILLTQANIEAKSDFGSEMSQIVIQPKRNGYNYFGKYESYRLLLTSDDTLGFSIDCDKYDTLSSMFPSMPNVNIDCEQIRKDHVQYRQRFDHSLLELIKRERELLSKKFSSILD